MTSFKQSAPDWCFIKDNDPATYYAELKDIGFAGVEMVPHERRKLARDAGLQIVTNSAPGMMVGLNNSENHDTLIPEICEVIESASRDEIPNVIFFSGNNNGQDRAEGLQNCISAVEKLLPVARKNGVTLIFEILNSFDHVDYQADSSSYGFELVNHFDTPHVKVLYDIYHMFRMGEDVVADITQNLGSIAHLHIAGAPNRDNPALQNEIDYPLVIKAIVDAGYGEFWGQEFVVAGDSLPELQQAYDWLNNTI